MNFNFVAGNPVFRGKLGNEGLYHLYKLRGGTLDPKSLATLADEQDTFEKRQNPEAYEKRHKGDKCEALREMDEKSQFSYSTTLEQARKMVAKHIKNEDYDAILKLAGIKVLRTKSGEKVLSGYQQPSQKLTYKDLGVDEEKLLKGVKAIKGDASFANSSLEKPGDIKIIMGDVILHSSKIQDMSNVGEIRGHAFIGKNDGPEDYNLNPKIVRCGIQNAIN